MNGMVNEGARTVSELSEYGKLLIPIMTSAVAARGGGGRDQDRALL